MLFLPNGKLPPKAFCNFVEWIDLLNTFCNLGILIDQDGPTGIFYSEETNPETGEIGW